MEVDHSLLLTNSSMTQALLYGRLSRVMWGTLMSEILSDDHPTATRYAVCGFPMPNTVVASGRS